ncbi:alpha/beta fold hydrolase [Spirosoma sp. HMF4905]|uniref:Alpha/beta fold hydrolase n=1 Tax=Spirosoma arboris TaxID=2682092 RepID=A0A7K1SBL1_9BACT|nr:alpha/beta hydrolase [Spirosoma arboris]MVM31155.1 alpha/beta fold hydrolase [Spirosoma arboris]
MNSLALLLLSGAILSISNSEAQTKKSDPVKPTIILVHGLWADGSSWSKVIPSLVAQGYKVISVQNPTTSLENDIAATQRAIALAGGDVILVGHSWGGFVITEAGDNPQVKALVYVAAYAPDNGETISSLSDKAAPTQLTSFLQAEGGFISLTKEGVTKAFANDLSAQEQELVFSVQQPTSPEVFKGVASKVAWKQKPSWYIVASEDKTINPDLERLMAQRAKAKTTTLKSSHVAMLSKPNQVLEVILEAAKHVTQ